MAECQHIYYPVLETFWTKYYECACGAQKREKKKPKINRQPWGTKLRQPMILPNPPRKNAKQSLRKICVHPPWKFTIAPDGFGPPFSGSKPDVLVQATLRGCTSALDTWPQNINTSTTYLSEKGCFFVGIFLKQNPKGKGGKQWKTTSQK